MPREKFDPYQDLLNIRNRFMELLDRSFREELLVERVEESESWTPVADFYATEDGLVLELEIPGMNRDDIDISLQGKQLLIRGYRPMALGAGKATVHRMERRHGPFRRSVEIPAPIDPDRIQAKYADGVLTVHLPYQDRTQDKKIPVSLDQG
jgi:HSP20 family protein